MEGGIDIENRAPYILRSFTGTCRTVTVTVNKTRLRIRYGRMTGTYGIAFCFNYRRVTRLLARYIYKITQACR
jgi:hypothetical protein